MILLLLACEPTEDTGYVPHGSVAAGISAPLGEIVPYATDDEIATFARGQTVAKHRFTRAEGLGPGFNVEFCAACHERPVTGGSAGLYRNFYLGAGRTEDGAYLPGTSAGNTSGVVREYSYGADDYARPVVPDDTTILTQRNPIPFFGVGLLAQLSDEEILSRADLLDADGDGITGRPNYDRGFVGRFGRKSQTVSIEGFIRGPLNNHVGITSDPLSDERKAELPVDSSGGSAQLLKELAPLADGLSGWAQAAAPDAPLTDSDEIADPEMSEQDLFDLVSFSMLLAAPEIEELDADGREGQTLFDQLNCGGCHTPRLQSPRGPLPVYSDLLLHDMGDDLADGIEQGEATGSEFRTHPLWGITADGPFLHDGRAHTLHDAILAHDGEARASREAYEELLPPKQELVVGFLQTLGGRDQASPGLLVPGAAVPAVGEYGGPVAGLSDAQQAVFEAGRILFDTDFGISQGVGAPRYNGDSCRACHMDPVIGGAGPRSVNVMRHGILTDDGAFVVPAVGTVLHKLSILPGNPNRAQPEANIFEPRQTPHLFGLGLIEGIPVSTILANADEADTNGDGISGKPSWTDGARLGRFGWKAQVPTVAEFVRDAMSTELGMTVPTQDRLTFGKLWDDDGVADPEAPLGTLTAIETYLRFLGPPPRQAGEDTSLGEALFETAGCADCHTPSLDGVPLYSDLLLHELLPEGAVGIEDASANMREFRTAPLWGLAKTAPYLHDGSVDSIEDAILGHDGESTASRDTFAALSADDQAALLAFLGSL